MRIGFFKGLTFVELQEQDTINEVPFEWGKDLIAVGTEFERIGGEKERTSLKPGYRMKYVGMFDGYVLLLPVFDKNKPTQLELFPQPDRIFYLAPIYVNRECLLMQSSANGFWDIRA